VTWILLFLMQDVQRQDPRGQAERVRAAMASSLQSQRASVERQAKSAGAGTRLESQSRPASDSQGEEWWERAAAPISMPICDPVAKPELLEMINDAARKQSVDPALVREVARQESGFRPCAVSPKGAEGLMQLMPATQLQFDVTDPFDAGQSLQAGTKLLKQLLDRYQGDVPMALSAYNAGAGRVDKAGGVPEIPETKNYVMSILGRFLQ
jgi:soluble lytic murein transglycosylase-like protein